MFDLPDFDAHESVHLFHDRDTGLKAIIALHSTHRGPGGGGTRFWRYPNTTAALTDALRLSRGMSYKNAMAGLPAGGGKAVILADGPKTPALMEAFGRAVDSLGGRYVTAEDVGMSEEDMVTIGKVTRFVSGLPAGEGELGGSPGPATAAGVFEGLKAAAERGLGRSGLDGVRVAIQGVGSVGGRLAELLAQAGARLTLADVARDRAAELARRLGAELADAETIHSADVDVLAPCALGATLNPETIPEIRAKVIAGAANNQLATPADGAALAGRGIVWAPDYVINAGGIIWVTRAYLGETDEAKVMAEVHAIGARVGHVLDRAAAEGRTPGEIADSMAQRLIGR